MKRGQAAKIRQTHLGVVPATRGGSIRFPKDAPQAIQVEPRCPAAGEPRRNRPAFAPLLPPEFEPKNPPPTLPPPLPPGI